MIKWQLAETAGIAEFKHLKSEINSDYFISLYIKL